MAATDTVRLATDVSAEVAEDLRKLAQRSERSVASEIRLALRAWLDADRQAAT